MVILNNINKFKELKLITFKIATEYGHYDVVVMLLKAGANPNIKDIHGYTPLEYGIICQFFKYPKITPRCYFIS
jgi:hypothetical protein